MIAKHLVTEVEKVLGSTTQVLATTADGIKLLDTSMVYEGQKLATSDEIVAFYSNKK